MTEELHVPTMDRIRDDFIEAWSGHFMDGEQGAAEYFDQALSTHNARMIAAAEQRGAKRALRDAAEHVATLPERLGDHPIKAGAISEFLKYRARLEGDDD